jgi:porin
MKKYRSLVIAAALAAGASLHAESPVTKWWDGKYATGDWFGARTSLEDKGIILGGSWKANYFGVVDGGNRQAGAFDEQILFSAKLDMEKMLGIPGLSLNGSAWWRDGRNVNTLVGASPAFNPSALQVAQGWRLLPVYAQWESRDLLPVKDMITLAGGWTNPYYFFIQQPASQLFVNNALFQTKGLVNSGIPWSGANDTWGGHLKVKPTEWSYAQAGLYMAIPGSLDKNNHGLYFEGAYPQTSNGLYFVGEAGVTPKLGSAKLPGKYAFGGIYYGVENTSFNGQTYDARYALYWQADQMIFREPSPEKQPVGKGPSDGKSAASAKSFKEPVAPECNKPSEQGLYVFSFLSYAPKYNNAMPFYFHTGLVYKGLIPTRDQDQLGLAFAYGNYSYDKVQASERTGKPVQTFEGVLELDYRAQLTKFAYVQPFLQYSIRPNGTGLVENATILGAQMGVTF